ncbi:hypothetical protein Goe16_02170 [Bacillus phage vB_BsuM-Goe16]|nr:hypothetical protein Goe16_00230 [Bacillus phage vB_BsuM-Goe16]WCS68631.1 hypothetical protein Goe16_02170 [Bacillus phage vB_BsuM-Goe16]
MKIIELDLTKRYWCFHCHDHQPNGGLNDLVATFDKDIPQYAYPDFDAIDVDYYQYQIFDSKTRRILYEGREWEEAVNAVGRANRGLDPIETFNTERHI